MARIYSKANTASEVLRMTKSENLPNLIRRKWYSGFKSLIAAKLVQILNLEARTLDRFFKTAGNSEIILRNCLKLFF